MHKRRVSGLWLVAGVWLAVGCPALSNASIYDVVYDAAANSPPISPWWYGWLNFWDESSVGEQAVSLPASSQNGPAWQLTNVAGNQQYPLYSTQALDVTGTQMAQTDGWSLAIESQLVSSTSGAVGAQGLTAVFDSRAYAVYIGRDAANNLEATLNKPTFPFPTYDLAPPATAGAYYDYELRYDPATAKVSFYFEGQMIAIVAGAPAVPAGHPNVFQFGTINDATASTMNYRRASFVILDTLVSPAEQGDFNGDGLVSTADYSMWRDLLGSTSNLAADGNGNGVIDAADYDVWKSNFGSTVAAAVAAPVPEPAGLLLAAIDMAVATIAAPAVGTRQTKRAGMQCMPTL